MKSSIRIPLFLLLLFTTSFAWSQTAFSDVANNRVYFDAKDPKFYQPADNKEMTGFHDSDPLYFMFDSEGSLVADEDLNRVCNECQIGPHTYTISAQSSSRYDLLNFFFCETNILVGTDTEDYGIVQFTTITQTELDEVNSLLTQSHHFEIEEGKPFSMSFTIDPCDGVAYQVIIHW